MRGFKIFLFCPILTFANDTLSVQNTAASELGETIKEEGNWSSWPPHKHDEDQDNKETKQKEIYLYKFDQTDGFGVQIIYNARIEECHLVKNNSEILIEKGYHPVVSSPHSKMYYFWALFGDNKKFLVNFDERFLK